MTEGAEKTALAFGVRLAMCISISCRSRTMRVVVWSCSALPGWLRVGMLLCVSNIRVMGWRTIRLMGLILLVWVEVALLWWGSTIALLEGLLIRHACVVNRLLRSAIVIVVGAHVGQIETQSLDQS